MKYLLSQKPKVEKNYKDADLTLKETFKHFLKQSEDKPISFQNTQQM